MCTQHNKMCIDLPLLCAAMAYEEQRTTSDIILRAFRSLLTLEGRRRRYGFVPRSCLLSHMASPWRYQYEQGNDQAMITLAGVDHKVFRDINNLFTPTYH